MFTVYFMTTFFIGVVAFLAVLKSETNIEAVTELISEEALLEIVNKYNGFSLGKIEDLEDTVQLTCKLTDCYLKARSKDVLALEMFLVVVDCDGDVAVVRNMSEVVVWLGGYDFEKII